uniref:VPS13 domain-containing protein n=1 Tax=Schistocephalus solidus TaxID=70667 RepID=A0A183TQB9_SCHSO
LSEAALAFREQSLLQVSVQAIEKNAGEDLSGDVQQRDSTVVVAELAVPFLLVEVYSGGIFEILGDLSLSPNLLEEHCANNSGKLVSPEKQVEADQAIVYALWQTEQTSHDVPPDGKSDTSVASL